MSRPWTEAHRREALRRTYEIAAELAGDGRARDAEWCCAGAAVYAETDELFYMALTGRKPGPDFDNARISREVRRVRALAEGRLVRETSERWRVYTPNSGLIIETDDGGERPDKGVLMEHLRGSRPDHDERCSVVHVRVTRIRRTKAEGKAK